MDKVKIVLSRNALRKIIIDNFDSTVALSRIKQHNILCTKSILNHYEAFFQDNEEDFLYKQWIKNIGRYDIIQLVDEINDDIYKDIPLQFKEHSFPIYIKTKSDSVELAVNNIELFENINSYDIDCKFNRYCIPSEFNIKKGDCFSDFKSLLSFLALNEQTIVVLDPYLFKEPNPVRFEKLYLPIFKKCSSLIVIYSDKMNPCQATITSIKKNCKHIKFIPVPNREIHDRYIYSKSWNIMIGIGLSLFDEVNKKAITESRISISFSNSNPSVYKIK